ncbi:MAG: hypothetical protein O7J95_20715, partial [Planctomycetota bacterium]|nr:hypothetical protein [Planctomycetota bacterium]
VDARGSRGETYIVRSVVQHLMETAQNFDRKIRRAQDLAGSSDGGSSDGGGAGDPTDSDPTDSYRETRDRILSALETLAREAGERYAGDDETSAWSEAMLERIAAEKRKPWLKHKRRYVLRPPESGHAESLPDTPETSGGSSEDTPGTKPLPEPSGETESPGSETGAKSPGDSGSGEPAPAARSPPERN